jgi:diaminopimelate epimerase
MKTRVNFAKMQGAGNDYIYIDCRRDRLPDPSGAAVALSDRHFGVGADGLVLIESSQAADFRMRMFNADGSEAEMCGNAVRCIGKYVYERGLWQDSRLTLETGAGIKTLQLTIRDGSVAGVRVDMGRPEFDPRKIPVLIEQPQGADFPFEIEGRRFPLNCVSMGNPHAVFFVTEITDDLVLRIGPQIERHPLFPKRTNVEFARVENRSEITLRVWERGSGETLACGTGACAVLAAAVASRRTDNRAVIHLRGGDLQVEWDGAGAVFMSGPAEFVFDGTIEI